jgi:peptide/nickel transport system substrate-binding protein
LLPAGHARRGEPQAAFRTFLISDIRGYSSFAATHGDEATAALASRFAEIATRVVGEFGGQLLGLRGDEVLAAFESPRQAIRCAVSFQRALYHSTEVDRSLPMPAGAGLDVGEAIPAVDGYRANAINVAARLCSIARAGEILATREVTHLAQAMDGVRYEARPPTRLKGIADPVHYARVVGTDHDTARAYTELGVTHADRPPTGPWSQSRKLLAAANTLLILASALLIAVGSGGASTTRIAPNSLGVISLRSAAVRASIPVRAAPTGVAVGYGAVWMTSSVAGTVSRIDIATHSVTPIPVGVDPTGIAVGAGGVWVANSGSSSVSKIDPQVERVVLTVPVGSGPAGVAISHATGTRQTRVWVTNTHSATVSMVDPASAKVVKSIAVGSEPSGIAAGAGPFADSVWVAMEGSDDVQRLDAIRGAKIGAPIPVGAGPIGVTFGAGAVWVANSIDGSVTRIDAAGQRSPVTTTVGPGAYAVAVADRRVWVSNQFGNSISVLETDPARQAVLRTIPTESAPLGLAIGDGQLWVAADGSGAASHRGGVLTAVASTLGGFGPGAGDVLSIDTAPAYDPTMWKLVTMTNDGLVGYRRVGGVAGTALLPDLATSLPQPTDNGTTYTFQLRSGIRYSTGRLVRPEDFRTALERGFESGQGPTQYFTNLVGGDACQRTPASCDLSRGVVSDDRDNTVTFHLVKPDPEFPYQLALPIADAVPSGTPEPLPRGAAVPATGPYMVASYHPSHGSTRGHLLLVRNPYFHVWSAAVRPDGFADRIDVTIGYPPRQEVSMVERGTADVMWDPIPFGMVTGLNARYPARVHINPPVPLSFVFLNSQVPPFNNRDARLAVNYAIDRRQMGADARGNFGVSQNTVTCQIIPPAYPGYVRRCPFTIDPTASGRWLAPNRRLARRLVARSGTTGDKVVVAVGTFVPPKLVADLTVALRTIGYRPRIQRISSQNYAPVINSDRHLQAGFYGWGPDYVTASNFINPLTSCDQIAAGQNPGHFCDRAITNRINKALADQAADPGRATSEWAALDRDLLALAPLVPFVNGSYSDFVAARVGNYQAAPLWQELVDQLWVR